jgi:GNAT superfamily N-acetyltransferase
MPHEIREALPPMDQFWPLFLTLSAYEGDELIGFGRVVSDGVVHAMIYDLIVAPARQGQGLGSTLLDLLVQRCLKEDIRDIQLFCARGKSGFYEKRGFVARPADAPGMQFRHPASPGWQSQAAEAI